MCWKQNEEVDPDIGLRKFMYPCNEW